MSDDRMKDQRRLDAGCARLRAGLLTAEPAELRGQGASEIAQHIRSCARCARDAQQILRATALLAADLNATARLPARPSAMPPAESLPTWWALPIAAVLATVLIASELRRESEPEAPRVGWLREVQRPVEIPVVNVPADRNVAVFRTAENITVVWDLGAKGGS